MSRHAMEHAFCADVFMDIRPMNSVTIAYELPVVPLSRGRFREAPRPRERDTYHPAVDQARRDGVIRHFNVSDSIFNADRSAHAKTR